MKKILAILLISIIFFIFGADLVHAQLCEPCSPEGATTNGLACSRGKWRGCPAPSPTSLIICNPLQACDFAELVDNIIGFIFLIGVALAPLMIIIGAFYILTAGDNPRRVEIGKNIILYTLIGLVIILLSRALVYTIHNILSG